MQAKGGRRGGGGQVLRVEGEPAVNRQTAFTFLPQPSDVWGVWCERVCPFSLCLALSFSLRECGISLKKI